MGSHLSGYHAEAQRKAGYFFGFWHILLTKKDLVAVARYAGVFVPGIYAPIFALEATLLMQRWRLERHLPLAEKPQCFCRCGGYMPLL